MKYLPAKNRSKNAGAFPPSLALKYYPADLFPETLPNPFVGHTPQVFHPQFREIVAGRFLEFMGRLDECRSSTLVVSLNDECLKVYVFNTFSLVFAPAKRLIGVEFERFGEFVYTDFLFDVTDPLKGEWWIWLMLRQLGLSFENNMTWDSNTRTCQDQSPLGCYAHDFDRANQWMVRFAWEILQQDRVFSRLRADVQKHFAINPELLELARQCARPGQDYSSSSFMNLILHYESPLARITSVSPELLPLITSYLEARPARQFMMFPLKTLREYLTTKYQVTPAAWRYLVRHGSRMFNVPWKLYKNREPLHVAGCFLGTLAYFGLPQLPPEPVMEVLLQKYVMIDGSKDPLIRYIPAHILQIAFAEANRRYTPLDLKRFIQEFLTVCTWAEDIQPTLDKNQKRKGWPYLVLTARQWENWKAMVAECSGCAWTSLIDRCHIDDYDIIPLTTSDDLLTEGYAMRNCVRRFIALCKDGECRFFSVREFFTGKRVATIMIGYDDGYGPWFLGDAKGYANQSVSEKIFEIGKELANLYQEQYAIQYERENAA